MKSFLVVIACSMLVFSGCERHPVAQLQEMDERSEVHSQKKSAKAEGEPGNAQGGPTASANSSPRAYFPADAK